MVLRDFGFLIYSFRKYNTFTQSIKSVFIPYHTTLSTEKEKKRKNLCLEELKVLLGAFVFRRMKNVNF